MLRFSNQTRFALLFFCMTAILGLYQTIDAQSRRQQKKEPASTEQTTPVESKLSETKPAETKPAETIDDDEVIVGTPERISSMLVVGEIQQNSTFYKSNYVEGALKEFISFTKLVSKTAPEMTRGEKKMSYSQAKERAKTETGKYVLWIGFMAKDDGWGNLYIEVAQYALFKPQSGKVLTRSQVRPGQESIVGGVKQIRVDRRRTSAGEYSEMKDAARQISAILLRGGWLN